MVYYIRIPKKHEGLLPSTTSNTSTASSTSAAPSPSTSAAAPSQDPEVDEEGLLKAGYDVILCGTGLVQSILASALARAGKTVLQCDGNDYYGEMDAVLSLDQMVEWARKHDETNQHQYVSKEQYLAADGEMKKSVVATHIRSNDASCDEHIQLDEGEAIIDLDPAGGCAGLRVYSHSLDGSAAKYPQSSLLNVGVDIVTPFGEGRVISLPTKDKPRLTVKLTDCAKSDTTTSDAGQKEPMAYFGYKPTLKNADTVNDNENVSSFDVQAMTVYYEQKHGIITKSAQLRRDLINQFGRRFALDLTPGLIYATGDAVDGLVKSGVADYLEFKSAESIHLLMEASGGRRQPRGGGRSMRKRGENTRGATDVGLTPTNDESQLSELQLSRVPCSKGDVFQTKLLSPVEKRRLMKFLQLASDYAIAESANGDSTSAASTKTADNSKEDSDDTGGWLGDETERVNNDATAAEESEMDNIQSLNERQLLQGRSLTRPQNKVVSTIDLDTLREYISRNADFDDYLSEVHSLPDRLKMIVIYAMALGSASASSTNERAEATGYSTGQAMADLCRHLLSLGRYGGTAFLIPMYGSGELSQSFCRSAAVHGATYLLRRPAKGLIGSSSKYCKPIEVNGIILGGDVDPTGQKMPDKVLKAKHVVVPREAMPACSDRSGQRILRRISILNDRLIVGDNNVEETSEQRHIIVIPPNTGNIGNNHVIHGVVLDDSVSVAPRILTNGRPCSILHLTTTASGTQDEIICPQVLERTAQALIAAQSNRNMEELYHITYSYKSSSCNKASSDDSEFKGLIMCSNASQSITLESAFQKARGMFDTLCPGADFLSLSEAMNELVRERRGDGEDSDDEKIVLESAMDLIDTNAAAVLS